MRLIPDEAHTIRSAVRQRAQELGFDDCRFTTAGPPDSARQFERWLSLGWQGEMAYLARNAHKRLDPQQVLPGAKSIIALAASYSQPPTPTSEAQGSSAEAGGPQAETPARKSPALLRGVQAPVVPESDAGGSPITHPGGTIARYARYADYHAVLGERLKALTARVNELGGPGTRSVWYVDTGPLLERDLAQRAGLGFIGKHTNLISRRLGNWIFLGEILTTLELEPDAPEVNRCGSCSRCLAVCPWNRFAREGRAMKHHARADLATPDLLELLALDEAGFVRRFAGTPMARAKRRGLLRNVCVALGNVGGESVLAALADAAADPEPLIAEHARWAINAIRARRCGAESPRAGFT